MKIRGKEYDEQQFTNDIQRHIDWLWPLPPIRECHAGYEQEGYAV